MLEIIITLIANLTIVICLIHYNHISLQRINIILGYNLKTKK